jgi:hypothetical protein
MLAVVAEDAKGVSFYRKLQGRASLASRKVLDHISLIYDIYTYGGKSWLSYMNDT